jgi:hypothetical protein
MAGEWRGMCELVFSNTSLFLTVGGLPKELKYLVKEKRNF